MQPSDLVPKFLETLEGCKLNVYSDSAGKTTIGIGHLLTQSEQHSGKISIHGFIVSYGNGITRKQAETICLQDMQKAIDEINEDVAVDLSQNQFDALTLFVFNIGVEAFHDSTLLSLLNQGRYDQVPPQMQRWIHCSGVVERGLINRRDAEIKVWNGSYTGQTGRIG